MHLLLRSSTVATHQAAAAPCPLLRSPCSPAATHHVSFPPRHRHQQQRQAQSQLSASVAQTQGTQDQGATSGDDEMTPLNDPAEVRAL